VETIRSKDGTTIAFDRLGDGPVVIVVGGATCDREMTRLLAPTDTRGGGPRKGPPVCEARFTLILSQQRRPG
jgi:hypothetical protein